MQSPQCGEGSLCRHESLMVACLIPGLKTRAKKEQTMSPPHVGGYFFRNKKEWNRHVSAVLCKIHQGGSRWHNSFLVGKTRGWLNQREGIAPSTFPQLYWVALPPGEKGTPFCGFTKHSKRTLWDFRKRSKVTKDPVAPPWPCGALPRPRSGRRARPAR